LKLAAVLVGSLMRAPPAPKVTLEAVAVLPAPLLESAAVVDPLASSKPQ